MNKISEDLSSAALARAIDENLLEKSLSFPRFFQGEIYGPNPLWFITGAPLRSNNGVVRANLAPGSIDTHIKSILDSLRQAQGRHLQTQGLPLTWWVGPTTSPTNLGKHLQAAGFTHNRDMIGMAIDLHTLPAAPDTTQDLEFALVNDVETLLAWYEVFLQGFPTSFNQAYFDALAAMSVGADTGWRHYVGRLRGKVVTVSSLFLGAGVAGLYNLTTLTEARGEGIGAWMTIKTFEQARSQGYRIGTLQTTYPNALRLYHRLGFEVYCKIGIYNYHV